MNNPKALPWGIMPLITLIFTNKLFIYLVQLREIRGFITVSPKQASRNSSH